MYACLLIVLLFVPFQQNHKKERNREPHENSQQKKPVTGDQGISISNFPQQTPVNPTQQHQYDASTDFLYRAYLAATILGVIGGLIGLRFVYKQLILTKEAANAANVSAAAAKKTAEVAEHALQISERADVLLDQAGLDSGTTLTGSSRVVLTYKNFGRTRAVNAKTDIRLILPGVPERHSGDDILPPSIIGANNTHTVSFHSFRQWLTEETFNQMATGRIELRFTAHLTYEDVFGEEHIANNEGIFYAQKRVFIVEKNEAT